VLARRFDKLKALRLSKGERQHQSQSLTPRPAQHKLIPVGIFALSQVGWFSVFGLGFLIERSASGDDFRSTCDDIRDLKSETRPGSFSLSPSVDGDEPPAHRQLNDVWILAHNLGTKGILVKSGGPFGVRGPDRVF